VEEEMNETRLVGRRGFLQFAAGVASAFVVPDWGQRVFPMFPRTHSVTIHDELHGVVISTFVPWYRRDELGEGLDGYVTARELRAAGWTIRDNGKPLPEASQVNLASTKYRLDKNFFASPSGTLAIPKLVFKTTAENGGQSEWSVRSENYPGGILIGTWKEQG
jgi:hypothetical protein